MKSIFRYLFIFAAICYSASLVQAQCVPKIPGLNGEPELTVGTSACVRVCGTATVPATNVFQLIGNHNGGGADHLPVLTFEVGCAEASTNCDYACTAIASVPPSSLTWTYHVPAPPSFPNGYWEGISGGTPPCLRIRIFFNHDNVWGISITSRCQGCFCITYDYQLAVELLDFSAIAGDHQVDLHWSTASETDNDAFEIMRDGEMLTRIESDENSATGATYSWTDNNVVNGTTYNYTLVSVDIMGNREELATEGATPSSTHSLVSEYALNQNYPNPFNPETSISFNLLNSGLTTLKVFDLTGRQVATLVNGDVTAGLHTVSFNARSLASGVYLYSLTSGDFTATKKLMLLK